MDAQKIPRCHRLWELEDDTHPQHFGNGNGRRIALIINEFGDLGVDGDVLMGVATKPAPKMILLNLTMVASAARLQMILCQRWKNY